MKKCVIFAGRAVSPALEKYWKDADFIIAADAGYERARAVGVTPDLALGDYDSSPVPHDARELICLPAEKDDTDTVFCLSAIAMIILGVSSSQGEGWERIGESASLWEFDLFISRLPSGISYAQANARRLPGPDVGK